MELLIPFIPSFTKVYIMEQKEWILQRIFVFDSFQKWDVWNCFGKLFIVTGKYFLESHGMMHSKQIYSTK